MTILDIVLAVCFVPAVIQGISKGFVQQVISIASLIIGIWLAHRLSSSISAYLTQYFTMEPKVLNVITFMIIVILAVLLLYWAGELLTKVIKIATLGWLNRLLGVVFAVVKVALILGVAIMVFESFNGTFHVIKEEKLAGAQFYTFLKNIAQQFLPWLKSYL